MDLEVTEVEAEVWRLRFDPDRLLTITQIIDISGHKSTGSRLISTLRRLQSRNPGLPASSEEQELIDLALKVTGTQNLERAYQTRKKQVRRHSQITRELKHHVE